MFPYLKKTDAHGSPCTQSGSVKRQMTLEFPPHCVQLTDDGKVEELCPVTALAYLALGKAVGVPPFMLAISVPKALKEAVAAARPGVVRLDAPATAENLLRSLKA